MVCQHCKVQFYLRNQQPTECANKGAQGRLYGPSYAAYTHSVRSGVLSLLPGDDDDSSRGLGGASSTPGSDPDAAAGCGDGDGADADAALGGDRSSTGGAVATGSPVPSAGCAAGKDAAMVGGSVGWKSMTSAGAASLVLALQPTTSCALDTRREDRSSSLQSMSKSLKELDRDSTRDSTGLGSSHTVVQQLLVGVLTGSAMRMPIGPRSQVVSAVVGNSRSSALRPRWGAPSVGLAGGAAMCPLLLGMRLMTAPEMSLPQVLSLSPAKSLPLVLLRACGVALLVGALGSRSASSISVSRKCCWPCTSVRW